jgi:hypothetical protein
MRVPGVVFASRLLLPDAAVDRSLEQVANVATLPGIVTASYAVPDRQLACAPVDCVRAGLYGRDGRRRELRARQPAAARPGGPPGLRHGGRIANSWQPYEAVRTARGPPGRVRKMGIITAEPDDEPVLAGSRRHLERVPCVRRLGPHWRGDVLIMVRAGSAGECSREVVGLQTAFPRIADRHPAAVGGY